MARFTVRSNCLPLRYWLLIAGVLYACALIGLFLFVRTHADATGHTFLLLGGGLTAFVGVTFGLFQIAVKPRVRHLIQVTDRFAQGDWTARVQLTGSDEFATIGAAFNQMAEQLVANHQHYLQAEARSNANRDLLQGLLATIETVVWSTTGDGLRYHYISPSVEQVYGRPMSAFIDNPQLWLDSIHPADRESAVAAAQNIYCTGMKQLEYRIIRPDGTVRWLQDRTRLVRDQAGHPLRFDGVATDITAYKADQALLAEQPRFATLRAQLSLLLTQSNSLPVILQQCAAAVVQHLDAAFVRIWTYNATTQLLELHASAGLYTHLDGAHSRIAIGQHEIGRIAQQRQAHLCNDIASDPQISDHAWAASEGIVAFAGYPLLIDDTVVGVIATFARHPLSSLALEDLAFMAGGLAQLIKSKQIEVALRQSEVRNRVILDALPDTVFVTNRESVLLDTHSSEPSTYYVPIHEFLGKRIDEVLPPPIGQQLRNTIREAADGTRQLLEYPLFLQDKLHYFEARVVPLGGDNVLAIVRDVTERKQVEEERFIRKIAEAVPFMMYVYDLDEQRHVYVNHQVRQDLGYTPEEFTHLRSTFVQSLLHTADLQRFPDLLSRWHQAHDGEVFETEYQMKHKHGEWRWFAGRDTVFLRHPDGRVRQIIGTAQDITTMKRTQQQILTALKEKEALLKEVHHRVKNNLQIISSLLNLQAAQIKDAAILSIFTETKNRVRSMALLHEMLYRTENLARIDFPRYVDNLCAHLFRSYGVDAQRIGLQTAIASVTLDLDRAIPCGLIINELISNAVKHAFPEQRSGHVRVELQQLTSQRYQLQVCDNGIGLHPDLDLAQTESLGLSLVYDLTRQLDGEIHVDCTAGTAFTICFGP